MRAGVLAVVVWGLGACAVNRVDPVSAAVQVRNVEPGEACAGSALRVVTFNVHGEPGEVIARALVSDAKLRCADVIVLQEIEDHVGEGDSRAGLVAEALGMSHAYAPGYGLPGGGSHGVAIVSRLPLSDVRVIELPRHDVVFNSARRVALGATIDAGQPIRVYSVHLDNRITIGERLRQLAPVLEDAWRRDLPAIVAGDFNTSPFTWAGHVVPIPGASQSSWLERFVRAGGFETPTAASGPTSIWLDMRLDGIYTRGLTTTGVGVAGDVRVSDHLPLWIDVRRGPARLTRAGRR